MQDYRLIKCNNCNGTGYIKNEKCSNCFGKGEIKIILDNRKKN
jgi:DnaJ-class molecular chaperone